MAPQSENSGKDLKEQVLSRIQDEGICPRGRWFFFSRECLRWSLLVVATALSAVAVAISTFVIMHRQYALHEATHGSFWTFTLDVLPYLWLTVFVLAAASAYYHFRSTRRGYRQSFLVVIGATMIASVTGGVLLHYVGMSFVFDHALGKYLPSLYSSQESVEQKFWQRPEEGRLMARFKEELVPDMVVVVEDVGGQKWSVDISELFTADREYLRGGREVRLLGLRHDGGLGTQFHACGVFPWLYSHMMSAEQLKSDRAAAIERLYEHRDLAIAESKRSLEAARSGALPVDKPPHPALCAEIAAVKRLRD